MQIVKFDKTIRVDKKLYEDCIANNITYFSIKEEHDETKFVLT